MTARLVRLLEESTTEEEDAALLYGMQAYGFTRWAALDTTLAGIAAALSQISEQHARAVACRRARRYASLHERVIQPA